MSALVGQQSSVGAHLAAGHDVVPKETTGTVRASAQLNFSRLGTPNAPLTGTSSVKPKVLAKKTKVAARSGKKVTAVKAKKAAKTKVLKCVSPVIIPEESDLAWYLGGNKDDQLLSSVEGDFDPTILSRLTEVPPTVGQLALSVECLVSDDATDGDFDTDILEKIATNTIEAKRAMVATSLPSPKTTMPVVVPPSDDSDSGSQDFVATLVPNPLANFKPQGEYSSEVTPPSSPRSVAAPPPSAIPASVPCPIPKAVSADSLRLDVQDESSPTDA